jgi:hypothetical protein
VIGPASTNSIIFSAFHDHLIRALVFADSDKGRMTQVPIARPLDELNLDHDLRLHPMD